MMHCSQQTAEQQGNLRHVPLQPALEVVMFPLRRMDKQQMILFEVSEQRFLIFLFMSTLK